MPPKYVSKYSPAAGSVSIKKSLKQINSYINNIFSDNTSYPKINTECRFCEYNNKEHCKESERISLIDLQKELFISNNTKGKS